MERGPFPPRPSASPNLEIPESAASHGRSVRSHRKLVAIVLLLAAGGGISCAAACPSRARALWKALETVVVRIEAVPKGAASGPALPAETRPWDGIVTLGGHEREAMGITTTRVNPQTEPIQ